MKAGKKKNKYRELKIVLVVISLLMISLWGYVEIVNRNSKNMTGRQKVLKAVYPLWIWWANKRGINAKSASNEKAVPLVSFYSLKDTLIDGTAFDFAHLRGRKVLLVNTASDCGYTGQYDDLQKLSESIRTSWLLSVSRPTISKSRKKEVMKKLRHSAGSTLALDFR